MAKNVFAGVGNRVRPRVVTIIAGQDEAGQDVAVDATIHPLTGRQLSQCFDLIAGDQELIAKLKSGNIASVIAPSTEIAAAFVALCMRIDEEGAVDSILDLPLDAQSELFGAAIDATFPKGVRDFFDSWRNRLGLDAISLEPATASNDQPDPDTTTSDSGLKTTTSSQTDSATSLASGPDLTLEDIERS